MCSLFYDFISTYILAYSTLYIENWLVKIQAVILLNPFVNTKFPNCRKSNNWKEIWFANINLYWWIISTISISILLQKIILSDSMFIELDSNKRFSWLLLEDGLNGLHNRSLTLSLLEIYCSSSSSIPLNVLQVLQRFFKFFKDSWDRISLELELLETWSPKMRGDVLYLYWFQRINFTLN